MLQDRITYADVTILACMHSSYFRVAGVCGNNYFFLHLHLHLQRFLVLSICRFFISGSIGSSRRTNGRIMSFGGILSQYVKK